jgi:cytochrome c oxidase subunit 2
MHVHLYERIWLWVATLMIAGFLGAMVFAASRHAVHPPSHIETIDPLKVRTESEFAKPEIRHLEDGTVEVIAVAEMFQFRPANIRVPVNTPIKFRMTSPDVLHGFQIAMTNINAMIVPGYVSEMTVSFPRKGEYLILCNEYCGLSHHLMYGRLIVE